jgi:hypothetical protein
MKKIDEDETVAEPAPEPAPNAMQMVNLIGNVVDQKPSEFATTFDQIMKDRITQKIADRKAELSRDAFATAPVAGDEDDEPEEPDEEPEVKEPDENGNGEPIEEPDEEEYPIDDTEKEQPPPETAKTEEVEPINELGAKILGKYVKGASDSARQLSYGAGLGVGGASKQGAGRTNINTAFKRFDKSEKRQTGINRASDRLVKLAVKEDMSNADKKKVSST